MAVIQVKNLKKYFGKTRAIDGVSFEVEKGEIFGFLGPNGAGKTTTIRCLMDFIHPTSGEIKILGQNYQQNSQSIKKSIGYLPGNVELYEGWTGQEHINFLQGLRGSKGNPEELAQKLDFNLQLRTKHLSSGNRQKLGLILALMFSPQILILDELTVGLDPLLQNRIYGILEELNKKGCTIFMSSHNLPEVERLCSRVGIIKNGKLITLEKIENMESKRIHSMKIIFDGKFNKEDLLSPDVEIIDEYPDGLILNIKGDINPLLKKISQFKVKDLEITHATLEDIFLEFYQKDK